MRGLRRSIRDSVDATETKIKGSIEASTKNGKKPFSFIAFEKDYLGSAASKSFLAFFRAHIEGLRLLGQEGTARTYDSALSAVGQWIKTTNKWLKRYCEFNNLPIVTTYWARHTFASLAKSQLSVAMIKEMLGHSRISTTETYLGKFDDGEKVEGLLKVTRGIKKAS